MGRVTHVGLGGGVHDVDWRGRDRGLPSQRAVRKYIVRPQQVAALLLEPKWKSEHLVSLIFTHTDQKRKRKYRTYCDSLVFTSPLPSKITNYEG